MKDAHPYQPFIPDDAIRLIIGSIPPHRFCVRGKRYPDDVDFYYGSRSNGFWKLIGDIRGESFGFRDTEEAVLERKNFLISTRTGITDIIERCVRTNGGSSDSDLTDIEYRDPSGILESHPGIKEIMCTSLFVKRCLGAALGVRLVSVRGGERAYSMEYRGGKYRVTVLYSPSPNAVRFSGGCAVMKRRRQYSRVFGRRNS